MAYPNAELWSALQDGRRMQVNGKELVLSLADCGYLAMPTGRLIAQEPLVGMEREGNSFYSVPPGSYRVIATLADVRRPGYNTETRVAYATMLLDETAVEVSRGFLTPSGAPARPPELDEDGAYYGFPVDAGTACFVDADALASGMPDEDARFEEVTGRWLSSLDDPNHIRPGLANIGLPLAKAGENIVIVNTGWGDGVYPVVGGYDAAGRLIRVHMDFQVVPETETDLAPLAPRGIPAKLNRSRWSRAAKAMFGGGRRRRGARRLIPFLAVIAIAAIVLSFLLRVAGGKP